MALKTRHLTKSTSPWWTTILNKLINRKLTPINRFNKRAYYLHSKHKPCLCLLRRRPLMPMAIVPLSKKTSRISVVQIWTTISRKAISYNSPTMPLAIHVNEALAAWVSVSLWGKRKYFLMIVVMRMATLTTTTTTSDYPCSVSTSSEKLVTLWRHSSPNEEFVQTLKCDKGQQKGESRRRGKKGRLPRGSASE